MIAPDPGILRRAPLPTRPATLRRTTFAPMRRTGFASLNRTGFVSLRRNGRHRPAFTLVELLISLAIMALLLTATAAALVAATRSVASNADVVQSTALGRLALEQVMRQVRQCAGCEIGEAAQQSAGITRAATLRVVDPSGGITIYTLRDVDQTLTLTTAAGDRFVLARNVSAGEFIGQVEIDEAGHARTTAVRLELTITPPDGAPLAVSASAKPRRQLP